MNCRLLATPRDAAIVVVVASLVAICAAPPGFAQTPASDVLAATTFRSIGPMQQSGRFVDIAVPELEPTTIYMATASGGLWKSVNNGISWEPIFDNQSVISIGDIAVAPSNPNIVYVGTGEHTTSRSTYWGDGVYKSIDAGKTWTNVGLKESHHIGRVVIDPKNPDMVYVAALGHLYSGNPERGVYKTIDGGKTWTKSLALTADGRDVGASDLAMDPKNPKVLYAAAYDKERKPWTFNLGGPGGGIYKTSDAGKTWTKLTNGLPGGMLGRIGLAVYPKDPNILYANIENANKPGVSNENRLKELREGKSSDGMVGEEVYRSDNAGKTWRKVNETSPSPRGTVGGGPGYYYMQIRVDPNDANHVYVLTVGMLESKDGGKTWQVPFEFGGDNHAMWIDPANSKHMILGYDHGMGITYDGGRKWYHPDELPLAQLYSIGIDYAMPYNVYGGIQDNGSVRGPSTKRDGRQIFFEDWQSVGRGDGMFNVVESVTNRYLYNESQFGSITRTDLLTGERKSIGHPDQTLRYNWMAPILISPFDSNTIYHAANKLLKSTSRGDSWVEISPDLTTNDKTKLTVPTKLRNGNIVYKGGDGDIQYCTISTIDESPIVRDLLYVGTDDGNVWVTKDGGKNWAKLNDKIQGNPGYWVSRVIASRHFPGTAYLAYTGFRNDDFRPFLYKTTDYGETWTSIAGNLPNKSVNVMREDPKNPNLLFVGVDFGLYASLDAGTTWTEMKGLPTQPVHDLLIHPRENDLIVATHGRGFFIADIAMLEEMGDQVQAQDVYLFDVEPKVKWVPGIARAFSRTNEHFVAPSEPNGIVINYYLKAPVQGDVVIQVMQGAQVIAETKRPAKAGVNQVLWNMQWTPMSLAAPEEQQVRRGGGRRRQEPPPIPTFGGSVAAPPAEYTIVLQAGGKRLSKKTRVLEDVWFDRVF